MFYPKTAILGHFGPFFGIKSGEIAFILDEKIYFFKVWLLLGLAQKRGTTLAQFSGYIYIYQTVLPR